MKKKYTKPVIILRKEIVGEHSIEELAYRLAKKFKLDIICMPYHSTCITNLLKNIIFIKNIIAPTYYIISPSEAYLLPFLNGKKIITYHDLGTIFNSRNRIYKYFKVFIFLKPSVKYADYITFVSNQTKKEFLNFFNIPKSEKTLVIYNSYNPVFMPAQKKNRNECFTILHVGTAPRKNLLNVLKAINGLKVKIIIIGKLNHEQEELLSSYTIDYKNVFDISTPELVKYYQTCDLLTFPSSYEGFGMPIIEANASQIPIIAGDIDVLHEVGNNAAYYVNGENVDSIRNGIKTIMENKKLRQILIDNGIENCKRFSEIEFYSQYKKILGL